MTQTSHSSAHQHNTTALNHTHVFAIHTGDNERRTWLVVAITLVMMVVEIVAGWKWHSMALTADGWHMGTHAAAIAVSGVAYWLARRWAHDARFSFGPWKIEILGAYTSAILLAVVAGWMAIESIDRLLLPQRIGFDESIGVAVVGLVVNGVCAWLLHAGGAHGGHKHDLNMAAAYIHVLADALTSVLAIAALFAGKFFGWVWLDAAMGIVGAALIAVWAKGLIVQCAWILLDREMAPARVGKIRAALQADGDTQVTDLHITRVGPELFALHATVVADAPFSPTHYRSRLLMFPELVHVSIECNRCIPIRPERAV